MSHQHEPSGPEESELIIEQIEIGPMQNFTYLVGSRSSREVVVVDPAWDIDGLMKHIEARDLKLKGALVTHYHPDHCGGSFGGHVARGLRILFPPPRRKLRCWRKCGAHVEGTIPYPPSSGAPWKWIRSPCPSTTLWR